MLGMTVGSSGFNALVLLYISGIIDNVAALSMIAISLPVAFFIFFLMIYAAKRIVLGRINFVFSEEEAQQ
jgi:hypothetical protein